MSAARGKLTTADEPYTSVVNEHVRTQVTHRGFEGRTGFHIAPRTHKRMGRELRGILPHPLYPKRGTVYDLFWLYLNTY